LIIASPDDDKITIVITDITGKAVQQQTTQVKSGNNNLQLEVGNLSSGSYLLKVICANGCSSGVTKFVKQ